jgi:hypothetical protein
MTITTVPSVATGDLLDAPYLNSYLRDNMADLQSQITALGTETSWTPVVTQSATITKTVNDARYIKIGNTCVFWVDLSLTSAGTASNNITMTLPLTASGHTSNQVVGAGTYTDTSVPTLYNVELQLTSSTLCKLNANGGTNGVLGQTLVAAPATTAIAVASGDFLRAFGLYTWN